MSSTWTVPLNVVNLSWIDDTPIRPSSDCRFRIAGPGCHDALGETRATSRTPMTCPTRFRATTWTLTLPESGLRTKKRTTVDVVDWQSAGVAAELPSGSWSEKRSDFECTKYDSLPGTTFAPDTDHPVAPFSRPP